MANEPGSRAPKSAPSGHCSGDAPAFSAGAPTVTDPVDVYLNVGLACSASFPLAARDIEALAAPAAAHPIVQWRLAICGRSREDALRDLRLKGYRAENFWEKLKQMGPTDIIEIVGDEGEKIRIWIE